MTSLPHMTWLRAFEAAARHSSFSAAADELGFTAAAVSQQIRLLEKHLDASLFDRLPRGVALTDIGQAYAQPLRKLFADIQRTTDGLFESGQKKLVRARVAISSAALLIAPRLQEFYQLHPETLVQLSTSVWADRFGESGFDVDIRYGHGDWEETNAIHLGHEHAIVVCHPDFAKSFGNELTLSRLTDSLIIQIIGFENDWFRMAEFFGLEMPVPKSLIKVDSSVIALQLIASGKGSAIVLESFARPYIESGQLVAPFKHRLPVQPAHYLIKREGTEGREEVDQFCRWMTSVFQAARG